ncbi:MAG: hypothetical protein HFI74_11300 [Lachnospiraceae bacterium]|jgi:hypothetical protein|nr:hypothetical protein [Lachnospiraceae bacterium]
MKKYMSVLCCILLLLLSVKLAMELTAKFSMPRTELRENRQEKERKVERKVTEKSERVKLYLGSDGYLSQLFSEKDREALVNANRVQEDEVYSFLQGPRSWEEGIPWSGEWCLLGVRGNSFGNFGCGLCCMANIYDTLSPYKVSPWDMCEYAMSVTNYSPSGESGAIGWKHMKETLRFCGFTCYLLHKPAIYEEFQQQMEQMESAIVLISSKEDDTYWKDTPGHYVNIWLYRKEDDTVFLAEPGSPENNRSRIPLRYVYDALKTISTFQYLAVEEYQEEDNQWKADGIDELWNAP